MADSEAPVETHLQTTWGPSYLALLGSCVWCGKREALDVRKFQLCRECKAKWSAEQREKQKRLNPRWCLRCGIARPEAGSVYCRRCSSRWRI